MIGKILAYYKIAGHLGKGLSMKAVSLPQNTREMYGEEVAANSWTLRREHDTSIQ
jgi:hypothetical protein